MLDQEERLRSSLLRTWGALQGRGKHLFTAMFMLVCVGFAADIIVVISLAQWKTLSHMSNKQLTMVVELDFAVLAVVLLLGYLGSRILWRRMERLYERISSERRERGRQALMAPPRDVEKN